jgi:hypothetical protein
MKKIVEKIKSIKNINQPEYSNAIYEYAYSEVV